MDYDYEPEGYDLNGVKYLPDFWVSSWDSFVEIKPVPMTDTEIEKCQKLAELSGRRVLAIQGQPWRLKYFISVFGMEDIGGPEIRCELGKCRKCESLHIVQFDGESMLGFQLEQPCCDTDKYPLDGSWSHRLDKAFRAARAARFEFGQTPR